MRWVSGVGALCVTLGPVGCSSSEASEDSPKHVTTDAGDEGNVDSGEDAVSDALDPKCVALQTKLQNALDESRAESFSNDAWLAVSTESCPQIVLSSGTSGVKTSDLLGIASLTKTFVAALVLKLYAKNLLSLDDVVEKWISGVPNGDQITVKMLLNHTSGLYDYLNDPDVGLKFAEDWTIEEILAAAFARRAAPPGETYSYSNTNYILLGMIAVKVGGARLAIQIRNELLLPLDLENTFFSGEERVLGEMAPSYWANGASISHAMDPSVLWAAAGMVSPISETNLWIDALASGEVHREAIQSERLETVPAEKNVGYGLGLIVLDIEYGGGAGIGIGHDGNVIGFQSAHFHYPAKGFTISAAVNRESCDPWVILVAARAVLLQ